MTLFHSQTRIHMINTYMVKWIMRYRFATLYVTSPQKQVTDVSLVLKDGVKESGNLCWLIPLSASDGQKTDSANVVSFIGIS